MARFTTAGGSGEGVPGPQGPQGPAGADGQDAILPQDLGTTDSPIFSKITLTSNGAIDNITIGDDVIIGDGNIANHLVIVGNQDPTQGGIVLGNNKTEIVSSDGTNLTLTANNDIILNPGSAYAYLGTPTIGGETRIATLGDLVPYTPPTSTRWSPVFEATGLTFTGSGATYPSYNSYYVKYGQMVTFNIAIDLTTVTNFGTGQFKVALPFAPIGTAANHFPAWSWVDPTQPADELNGHVQLVADHLPGSITMDLHWLKETTATPKPLIESLLIQGTPITFTTASKLYINGTYISEA